MGKKKKRKRKNRGTFTPPPINNPPVINKNSDGEPPKKKKWWQKTWVIVMGLILILSGLATIKPVRELFMSKHAIYEEENFDTGTIKPLEIKDVDLDYDTLEFGDRPIFNKARIDTFPIVKGVKIKEGGSEVVILLGTGMWMLSKSILKKGIKIFNPITTDECAQTKLNLILKNDRIYASAEFRDLKNGQIVGTMDYNHWKVYLKNLLEYNFADDRLEVLDKQGYVIFSILFSDKGQASNGAIALSGYFMNPNSILIVNSDPIPKLYTQSETKEMLARKMCITKDTSGMWETEAEKVISKIKSVFDQ
jgi:hypothetical protein